MITKFKQFIVENKKDNFSDILPKDKTLSFDTKNKAIDKMDELDSIPKPVIESETPEDYIEEFYNKITKIEKDEDYSHIIDYLIDDEIYFYYNKSDKIIYMNYPMFLQPFYNKFCSFFNNDENIADEYLNKKFNKKFKLSSIGIIKSYI